MPKNKFGTSRGWYHESKRHSLARQGIQTGRKANMKRRWDHEKSYFSQEKFDTLSRNQQKGTIIDIAKKAYAGVSNAIKWENEHYNKQKQWVKDEYNEAKNAIKHTHDNLKKGETAQSDKPWLQDYINESDGDAKKFVEQLKKYTPTEIDKKEVEDEKDHNEDGTPDITAKTLNETNKKINAQIKQLKALSPKEVQNKTSKLQKLREKISDTLKERHETHRERMTQIIDQVGNPAEKQLIAKLAEDPHADVNLGAFSEATLEELSIRMPTSFIGGNKFENELFRRWEERQRIWEKKQTVEKKQDERKQEFRKELSGQKKKSGLNDLLGF